MSTDIRRALEELIPDAEWDFSVPNEGGDETDYDNIVWYDVRVKPSWNEIVSTASTFDDSGIPTKMEEPLSPFLLMGA